MTSLINATGPILLGHTFADAVEEFDRLNGTVGLTPECSRDELGKIITDLHNHADDLTLIKLGEVIKSSSLLIAAASGVRRQDLSKFLLRDEAARGHSYRNVLLAVVLIGARHTLSKADAEALATSFPRLRQRSSRYTRPHTDDETLLMRAWAVLLSEIGGAHGRRAAAVYAQCDAGLCAGETTGVLRRDLVIDLDDESLLDAPGHKMGVKARIVELDRFNATLLETHIAALHLAGKERLTYWPRNDLYDYQAACASAIGVVDRQRKAVGLNHDDTTNASVTMWRADYTERHWGLEASTNVSGRTAENHSELMRTRLSAVKTRNRNERKAPITF